LHNTETGMAVRERAIIVGVELGPGPREDIEASLDELELLADTAGADVVERVVQKRNRIDPAFFIGEGKLNEISSTVKTVRADMVIFDDDLSPAQVRNLENVLRVKVLDRSALILDIFAKHARTREAKIQVELAQLRYYLPRLTRQWTHLSRQVGGIGTRGPGETQLEVDRRRVRRKIAELSRALSEIEKQRGERRKRRRGAYRISIVGYTNAGKSTLLNALTGSSAFVEDRLFATLDATTRALILPGGEKALVTDTVGFIRKLPPTLVASFRSTLEEVVEADLILHVVDASLPPYEERISTVNRVLEELGASDKPTVIVWNKVDLLEGKTIKALLSEYPGSVAISALEGRGMEHLLDVIRMNYWAGASLYELVVPRAGEWFIPRLRKIGHIIERRYSDGEISVFMMLPEREKHLLDSMRSGYPMLSVRALGRKTGAIG